SRFKAMGTRIGTSLQMVGRSIGTNLLGVLGGPWGIAITGAIAALRSFAEESSLAEARQRELADAVNDTTGRLSEQADAQVFDALTREADGFWEKLKLVGTDVPGILDGIGVSAQDIQEKLSGSTKEAQAFAEGRSEEHTSELQSRFDLVCRLLLEKKKKSK